jgi:hypothetical protein
MIQIHQVIWKKFLSVEVHQKNSPMANDWGLTKLGEGFMHPKGITDRRWPMIGDQMNLVKVSYIQRGSSITDGR